MNIDKIKSHSNNSKWKDIKEALREIALSSTCQGLPNIVKSNSLFFRIFWTFFLIVSSSYCFYSIVKSINSYLNWEVITNIDVINEIPAQFPAVTFCNLNLFATDYAQEILMQILNTTQYKDLLNSTSISRFNKDAHLIKILFITLSMSKNLTDDNRKNLSLSLQDILIDCQFNSQDCTADDFDWFFDFMYGNCYTFNNGRNSKGERKTIQSSNRNGLFDGLILKLFLGNPFNVNNLIDSSGFHLTVHNNSLKPLHLDGINVANGENTYIMVKKTLDAKLEDPYNDCKSNLNRPDAFDSDFYRETFRVYNSYTQKHCFDVCTKINIMKNCECNVGFYSQTNPCHTLPQIKCTRDTFEVFIKNMRAKCVPYCPSECEIVEYSVSTSHSYYPNPEYAKLLKNLPIFKKEFKNYDFDLNGSVYIENDLIRKSTAAISVFYDDLKYTKLSQIAKMSFEDLMANLGGTLGLCVGISFLSFVEIFEAVIQALIILKQNRQKTNPIGIHN